MRASRNEKDVSALESVALKVPPARVESVIRALDEAEDKAGAAPCGMTGERRRRAAVRGERRRAAAVQRSAVAPSRRGVRPGPSRSAQA